MRRNLPSGTVTFLFTDVEGSTKLLHELGADAYAEKLAEHRRVVREACTAQSGVEVDTQGDAFFVAFPTAPEAVEAACAITEELASGPITLRIGLHTGTPLVTEEGYVGEDVNFAARVAASAHGGQVVLSRATRALLDERYAIVELGEHRLKDIPESVAIFQLGDGQFPPLKTISNTNLPRPASSFVGRESELSQLVARIEDGGGRLVTLTGPGGSGKTRLALEAAATLVPEYKAGVFWVGLASLREPALVTETIAQTLGAKDGLADHIGEREMLLLLDNLEQVIEAAPELTALLASCPNLTLLVTSRELLRVQGEIEYPVPPLAEPEAVSLFCQRAQTEPTEEISELCRGLDNLPLAVELAAARTKAVSPAQILARLSQRLDLLKGGRDADPRQETLRATIEWSYDLLSERERELFRRLGVFSGGCTIEAAEEVCDADLDTLQSLVEKSLLRFSNERYWMLETIRDFAEERLEEASESALVRERHASWAIGLAETLGEEAATGGREAAARLAAEFDNLRATIAWALERGDGACAARFIDRVSAFAVARGHPREAYEWAAALFPRGGWIDPELASGAHAAGDVARWNGDFAWAEQLQTQALEAFRERGDDRRAAITLTSLSELAALAGDFERARTRIDDAVKIRTRLEDPAGVAHARVGRAQIDFLAGDFRNALAGYDEVLPTLEGRQREKAIVRLMVGECARRLGDLEKARESFQAVAREAPEVNPILLPEVFQEVAVLDIECDRPERAARLLGASAASLDEFGLYRWDAADHERTIERTRAALEPTRFESEFQRGQAMSLEAAIQYVLGSLE